MKSRKLLNSVALFALILSLVAMPATSRPVAAQGDGMDKVEALVLEELAAKTTTDFLVWMTEKADLSPAQQLQTKAEKGQFVFDTLRATAERTQQGLRGYLDAQGATYRSFYIANKIWIQGGNLELLQAIAARPDVAKITANHKFQLDEPKDQKPSTPTPNYVEPNISFIKADQVWAMGITGQGTVMAGNDTGLDATHPTIAPHYRGCLNPPTCDQWDHNYNWWDAWGWSPVVPADDYGHGTHTTGTMIGDDFLGNQIGVAPGAQTVHCKNMSGGGGDDAHFIICFEWDLAPWDLNGQNPMPDKAPDAINNSWGYWGGNQPAFEEEIAALQTAGIAVEVSAGNEGSGCYSLRSPGDYSQVLTTGSVNHAYAYPGLLTGFSSRGPSYLYPDDRAIPDIMAPGENIRSALPGNQYGYWGGTSMAGPHATALVGLIWSANPSLRGQIDTTYQIIYDTAARLVGQGGSNCGGDYVNGPNNDWGYGTIDAYQAVLLAIAMGGAGTLEGTVTDAVTGLPVAGAKVHAVHDQGFAWDDFTDANGFYQMTVAAGTFVVTASHPHYQPETVEGVVVPEDGTTVQDFALTPRGWAYGTVTDFDNGTAIEGATVTAEDGSFATTDANGYYELWLDPGTHTLTAVAQDYAPVTAAVEIFSGQGTQQDFALQAAVVFIPSPIEVSVPLGSTFTQPATILNRQPWDYPFEFQEKDKGYLPLLGEPRTVQLPAGPAAAPDNTAVAAGPYQALPARTVTLQGRGGITQANVLLLAADDDNGGYSPIQQELLAYGDLGAVDLFDPRYSTPTLDQLLAYNVVVVWANYMFADANGIGNVLADYVDAGGKVIDLMFALDPNWGYQGRFRTEGYSAMTVSGTSYLSSCLGTFDPTHPIMDGVTNVCDLYRGYGTYLNPNSTEVARWQDNELFVAVKDDQSVASLNGYVGIYRQFSGQFPDVVHNAINWLAVPADVPWLAENPVSGVVPPVSSLPVDILFDASVVTQPGTYSAELTVKGEPKVKVPVVMTVEAPSNYGRLEGTVIGLGYCDASPVPLEEAEVVVTDAFGNSWTLLTDAAGYYALWLDEAGSPYSVAVSYPGYQPGLATGVTIVGGQTTVQDFDLRLDAPCMSADPLSMSVTLDLGASTILPFTLTNTGAAEGTFEMSDLEKGYVPMRQGFLPAAERPANPPEGEVSIGRAPNAPSASPEEIGKAVGEMVGEPAYAVDVYPGYNLVYFTNDNPDPWTIIAGLPGNQYFAGDFINGDFSLLYVIDYGTNSLYTVDTTTGAVTLIGPSTPYGGESWTGMTGSVDGTMYASSTNISRSTLYTVDLGTGAVTVVGEITNAPAIIDIAITPEGDMYGVDIVNDNLIHIDPATGAGTVIGYCGYDANYAQGSDYEEETGTLYLAAFNNGSYQGELRIADPATGNSVLVEAFPGGAEVDSMGFATGGGGDAPWLYENPVSGTVAPDGGTQVVDVTFDAGMVTQPGTYTGEVKAKTNDPVNKSFTVDATMVVNAPPDWGQLSGTVTGLGYCDQDPAPLQGAQVCIVGGLCLETDANGYYLLWLEQGTYDVEVTYDGHSTGYATVQIVGGGMTVQDFNLRWLQPCMSETPPSLEVTLDLGQTAVEQITLGNTGAAEGTFEASDSDQGYIPMSQPEPEGQPVTPQGASSDAKVQPFKSRINQNTILHITTTDTALSVQRALNELGYGYDLIYDYSGDWTGIDFSPYDIVIVGMDGGTITSASIQKVRTDVIDQGKMLIFLGGTCWQEFAMGVNTYLVGNDTNNYCWQVTNPPQWTLVDPGHPLADGLPDSYNYANYYAGYYQIRVTDPDAETVAINGESWPAFFRKVIDGSFIWYIDSVYSYYWDQQADFDVLKQLISNAIEFGGGGGDALWLSEDPTAGTVPIDGGTAVIDVTFDAGVVTQPGVYLANIIIKVNDPIVKKFVVPATMNVNGPPDWGRVEGIVSSLGYCDQNPVPLEGAIVTVDGTLVLETDANGHYSTWLPSGTHDLVVTADGHVGASASVLIIPQQITYQDFGLRSMVPCMSVSPLALEAWLAPDSQTTKQLSLINAGAGDANFKLLEMLLAGNLGGKAAPEGASSKVAPEGYTPTLTKSEFKGTLSGTVAIFKDANPWGSVATETFLAANGIPYEVHTSAEFGSLDFTNYGMIVFSGDQPQSFYDAYASYVTKFEEYVEQGGFLNFFSCDAGWNGGTLTAPVPGGMTWTGWIYENYNVVDDPAHPVMAGVPNPFYGNYASHGHFTDLPAEAHVLASEQSGGIPTIVEYPLGGGWLIAFGQPLEISYDWGWDAGLIFGNTLLWGYAFEPALDIPWLSEDPTQGTVPADTTLDVAVTFDSTGMTYGDYFGILKVKTGDANNPTVDVPVTLHVIPAGATMHVNGIVGHFTLDPYGRTILRMHVQAVDQDSSPLQDVQVDASIWYPSGGPVERSRFTKPSGWARFVWGHNQPGWWQLCVDNLTLAGYVYNPGDNVITCQTWTN